MIFYESEYMAVKDLPDKERLECYDTLFGYAFEGVVPDVQKLTRDAKMFFILAKPLEDANAERKENGAKGGRPRKDGNPPKRTAGKFINFAPSDTDWDSVAEQIMTAQ